MFKLLRFLFTGYWGPAPSVRSLNRRVDALEEHGDDLRRQIRRLRGWVTGGVRYEEEDLAPSFGTVYEPLERSSNDPDAPFPEDAFQRALEARRAHG